MFGLALGRIAECGQSPPLPTGLGGDVMRSDPEPSHEQTVDVGGVPWLA